MRSKAGTPIGMQICHDKEVKGYLTIGLIPLNNERRKTKNEKIIINKYVMFLYANAGLYNFESEYRTV